MGYAMSEQDFDAFKKAWSDYPSQDNEGFRPDRGGFKCGWFAALKWERSRSSYEQGVRDALDYLESDDFGVWQARDMETAVNPGYFWAHQGFKAGKDIADHLREKFGVKEC